MKDEIKEILDNIKIIIDEGHYRATCDIDYEDCKILYNYITNLQEENKELKKKITFNEKSRRKMQQSLMEQIETYKSRNEKAIEYNNQVIKDTKDFYRPTSDVIYSGDTLIDIAMQNINILNGGDE